MDRVIWNCSEFRMLSRVAQCVCSMVGKPWKWATASTTTSVSTVLIITDLKPQFMASLTWRSIRVPASSCEHDWSPPVFWPYLDLTIPSIRVDTMTLSFRVSFDRHLLLFPAGVQLVVLRWQWSIEYESAYIIFNIIISNMFGFVLTFKAPCLIITHSWSARMANCLYVIARMRHFF